jgi:hypothetical protein
MTAVNCKVFGSLPVFCTAVCIRVLQPPPTPPYTVPPPLSTHTRPNPGPLTAIAPLIMAELRVGSVPLAATDASWKTHMSQVWAQRKLNHKPLNHKPQTTNHKPQTPGHEPIPNLAPCHCRCRTLVRGKMAHSGAMLWMTT